MAYAPAAFAVTKGHGVMTYKALPALGADADKVGSESVKFWFRLASAAVKRSLRIGTPKRRRRIKR